jgi:hypothetical protein
MSKKLGQARRALKAKQKFGAIGLTRSRLAADLKNSYRHGRVVSSGNRQRLVRGPDAELRSIISKSKDVAKRQTKYAKVKQSRDSNKNKIILKRKKELVTRHVKKNKGKYLTGAGVAVVGTSYAAKKKYDERKTVKSRVKRALGR